MGKNWAICVGVNNYYSLKSLKYAQRDAESFRDFCVNEANFERVYFFAEGAEPISGDRGFLRAEPTIGNLERFLRVRFEQEFLEPGDNLWFFFAGHGKRDRGRDYLMPIDGDPGNVGRTGIAIRDIADRLRRSGADNVLLFLDACRTGDGSRDGSSRGIGAEKQQGCVTIFSCSPDELSYETDELQAGTFTYALIEGLQSRGENSYATVEQLYRYLRYRVPEINKIYQKPRQNPYAITEPANKLHLVLFTEKATQKDILTLKNDAMEAEDKAELHNAEQLWIRILELSPADSQAIRAIQRIYQKKSASSSGEFRPPKTQDSIHSRDGFSFIFLGANLGLWIINISILVKLYINFLSQGLTVFGVAGVAALATYSLIAFAKIRADFTTAGREGMEAFLSAIKIPRRWYQEVQFSLTALVSMMLISVFLALPSISQYYNRFGIENHNMGKIYAAEQNYRFAIALDPNNFNAHYNLATLYEDIQELDEAETQYLIATRGDVTEAYNNLARLYIQSSEPQLNKAIALLNQGINLAEHQQSSPEVKYSLYKNLGWALFQNNNYYSAQAALMHAVSISESSDAPGYIANSGSAYCLLAQVKEAQTQTDALQDWENCLRLGNPLNPEENAWVELARQRLSENVQ